MISFLKKLIVKEEEPEVKINENDIIFYGNEDHEKYNKVTNYRLKE